jgi:hypothetical protein
MLQDSRIAQQETYMKTMTTLLATAALITGIAAANAQGTTRQMDEQAGGNSSAVERNPARPAAQNPTRRRPQGQAAPWAVPMAP